MHYLSKALSGIFFFGGGTEVKLGSQSEEIFQSHAAARKIFQGLKGSEGCSPLKCQRDSVQDWLKSHLWTLVTCTDSVIAVLVVCILLQYNVTLPRNANFV